MIEGLKEILGTENVLSDEPMCRHTTFKIGGNADLFLTPENETAAVAAIKILRAAGIPIFILGNGSNILVGDKGIRGAVVCFNKKMSCIEAVGDEIYASAGAILSAVSAKAAKAGLAGTEFASGIPGSVGGAIYMNAGAYNYEIKDIVKSVRYIDSDGNIFELKKDACGFAYRRSVFADNGYVILGCTFGLKKGSTEEIRAQIKAFTQRRVSKQPLEMPSAGSTFKRPDGYFAGALIEAAGLKGKRIGGAEVSTKHAGFLVNSGNATARDVLELIEYVKTEVYKNSGVMLEPEVKLVGDF